MAPAEVDIFKFREGASQDKVHAGQSRDFTIGNDIKAKVFCDVFNTSVSRIRYMQNG